MVRYVLVLVIYLIYLLSLSTCVSSGKFSKTLLRILVYHGNIWGGLCVAALVAIPNFIAHILSVSSEVWIPIIASPIIEETCKFVVIYLWNFRKESSRDRLIRYSGSVGLSFATIETLGYVYERQIGLSTVLIRSMPVHIITAMILGYGISRLKEKSQNVLWFPIAIMLHSISNLIMLDLAFIDVTIRRIIIAIMTFSIFLGFLFKTSVNEFIEK